MLRFDVETISKATFVLITKNVHKLRFDVETISKATLLIVAKQYMQLRFDVETISKATNNDVSGKAFGCGLM